MDYDHPMLWTPQIEEVRATLAYRGVGGWMLSLGMRDEASEWSSVEFDRYERLTFREAQDVLEVSVRSRCAWLAGGL